jgi:hypothetical protein
MPTTDGAKSRELLLCVLPWPQDQTGTGINDIQEEFPDLEIHYIYQKEGTKVDVPEGKDQPIIESLRVPLLFPLCSVIFLCHRLSMSLKSALRFRPYRCDRVSSYQPCYRSL